jgi:predicted phage terminase large subunit-like protein
MLTSPGSIWHEAVSLYSQIYPTGLKIRERKLEIVFPNGALLKFSHMQHATDMYDHKGGQYSLVIFDEATDFTEDMVVYLLSRMRNAYVDYKPKMFMMTNPHYDSFLRLWIQDYYLDARGIPIQERTGNKRWFFRQGNTMLWYNSREEAVKVHGEGDDNGVSSFTFIGATCQDNPPLLKAQPGYITNLLNQPRVEMERLLLGSWFARVEAAGHWKREWITEVDGPNPLAKQRVRAWDFAFTKPSESSPNPDYTCGVLISKDIHKVYTVENVVSMRDRVHEVEKLVFETAKRDGTGVVISIPKDPNAQAGAYARDLQRRLGERGYMVRLCPPVKSKLTRFAPFSSISQSGFVQVVKADWNKEYYEELEVFDGEGKSKDDQVDATSDCITLLNREITLPNSMSLPNLSTNAPPTFNFNQGQNIISLPTFNI